MYHCEIFVAIVVRVNKNWGKYHPNHGAGSHRNIMTELFIHPCNLGQSCDTLF